MTTTVEEQEPENISKHMKSVIVRKEIMPHSKIPGKLYRVEIDFTVEEYSRAITKCDLKSLTDKELYVLAYRYGILGAKNRKTLEAIGEDIGLSRSRVYQIERLALRKIECFYINDVLKLLGEPVYEFCD